MTTGPLPLFTLMAVLTASSPVRALPTEAVYRTPSQDLVDIVDAPMTPWLILNPYNEWILLLTPMSNPPIEELAERELKLAGMRFRPATDGPSRSWFCLDPGLLSMLSGQRQSIEGLPDEMLLTSVVPWSPDGEHLLLINTVEDGNELWLVSLSCFGAERILEGGLSLVAEEYPVFMPGSESILCCLVPEDRGFEPESSAVPAGPMILETSGATAPARTYADLLENEHDAALFEHYMTTQLARVGLEGEITPLGEPCMVWSFDPSPDGRFILVEVLHRPFSYTVPVWRFPTSTEVWSAEDGEHLYTVADLPLREEIPITYGSTHTGPRSVHWRSDEPATLCWVEALDGGDAAADASMRDRVFVLAHPFGDSTPDTLATLEYRFGGIHWSDGEDLAIVTEWWWPNRISREWRLWPDTGREPALLLERSWEDRYSDPGRPVTTENASGKTVLLPGPEGGMYLIGQGASPEGNRPFLDVRDLETMETTRLFQSQAPWYEQPMWLLPGEPPRLLLSRESVEQPRNYYVLDLDDGAMDTLTRFPNPTPQLAGYTKELLTYEREDGVGLSARLLLPPGYDPETDDPLPMLFWAYPQEYQSRDAAGQVSGSPYTFDRLGWWSPLVWLTKGYGVLYGPSMPIVAEDEEGHPNDLFVEQLVMSAQAAVDLVVGRGVADPERLVVAGHSYGAFMAANLLAHSDLFAAGIAQTGAYNRTLTPFGFQSEDRTLWEAPEVYFAMSPFMHADSIDEPILLVHGEADDNAGTRPMQSERMFEALKGLGGTARLVMLPLESHGYRARESILHLLWETQNWLAEHAGSGWSGD